jgi:ABC-2 type transport system permease protein
VVAQFLRLKSTILANALRRRPALAIAMTAALLYGLVLVAAAAAGVAELRDSTPAIARAVVVVVGSAVTLGALVLPLVFGADDSLDPRRFALLGLRPTRLAVGIAVAASLSVPTFVVTVLALGQVVTWARGSQPALLAGLSAVLIVLTCLLGSRVSGAIAALWLSTRRARDAVGIILTFVLAIATPVAAVIATVDWESRALPVLRRFEAVLGWTPLGAAWAVPADAANDEPGTAMAKLAIAVGFVLVLALIWRVLVGLMLRRQDREPDERLYTGLGWFRSLPATPVGVVAARSLSYWGRDTRYRMSLAAVPVVPVIAVAALLVGGVPGEVIMWVPVPLAALFLGWLVHNDLAADSSAFWTHLSASTKGVHDRWGRLVPVLVIGIPLIAAGGVVSVALLGEWDALPALLGLSFCVLFAALGISSVTSAAFPYPTSRPGDSAFAQPQTSGSGGSTTQAFALLLALVIALPVVACVVLSRIAEPWWTWVALGGGILLGLVTLAAGAAIGGRIVDRRGPELLAFTLQN